MLFSAADWTSDPAKYKGCEKVVSSYVHQLSYLGEHSEVDKILEKYERSVINRDARFINYCQMRCFSKWVRGDLSSAVDWGKVGQRLKDSSNVDTHFDIDHTLALAQRDAGEPELALTVFLVGRKLSDVVDPEELDELRGGAHYGNIGRSLHLMGQIDSALICYQKSALLIEKDSRREHFLHQGYIRAWIGELLFGRGQLRLAEVFYRAACLKWEKVFPEMAAKLSVIGEEIRKQTQSSARVADLELENIIRDWILGRDVDSG